MAWQLSYWYWTPAPVPMEQDVSMVTTKDASLGHRRPYWTRLSPGPKTLIGLLSTGSMESPEPTNPQLLRLPLSGCLLMGSWGYHFSAHTILRTASYSPPSHSNLHTDTPTFDPSSSLSSNWTQILDTSLSVIRWRSWLSHCLKRKTFQCVRNFLFLTCPTCTLISFRVGEAGWEDRKSVV